MPNGSPTEANGWNEWSKHVLAELKRQNNNVEKLFSLTSQCKVEIAKLQVKASVWGGIGGVLAAIVAMMIRSTA